MDVTLDVNFQEPPLGAAAAQDLQIYTVDQSIIWAGAGSRQFCTSQPARPGGSRNAADWGRQEQMAP